MESAISREGKIITYDWRPGFTEDVTFELGLAGGVRLQWGEREGDVE